MSYICTLKTFADETIRVNLFNAVCAKSVLKLLDGLVLVSTTSSSDQSSADLKYDMVKSFRNIKLAIEESGIKSGYARHIKISSDYLSCNYGELTIN